MYRVTKNLHFCYGHRLLNYPGKCAHLHGHNALVQVEFESHQLDSLGMLIDFDEIKDRVQTFLDEYLDHRLILNEQDPFVPFFQEKKEPLFLMKENPTAENLAKLIFETIQKENMPIVSVKFWETSSACAEYSNSIK